MTLPTSRILAATVLAASLAAPVAAGSLVGSSAAGGSSASSLGSASSEASSDSSSRTRTAAATWRITDLAALPDAPGAVRLQLELVPADGEPAAQAAGPQPTHALVLPADTVTRQRLAVGQIVTTQPQAYGVAYALRGGPAFFLALDGAWQRELDARPVQL